MKLYIKGVAFFCVALMSFSALCSKKEKSRPVLEQMMHSSVCSDPVVFERLLNRAFDAFGDGTITEEQLLSVINCKQAPEERSVFMAAIDCFPNDRGSAHLLCNKLLDLLVKKKISGKFLYDVFNFTDKYGNTALGLAAFREENEGLADKLFDTLLVLEELGKISSRDVFQAMSVESSDGFSPLLFAAIGGNKSMLNKLLDKAVVLYDSKIIDKKELRDFVYAENVFKKTALDFVQEFKNKARKSERKDWLAIIDKIDQSQKRVST